MAAAACHAGGIGTDAPLLPPLPACGERSTCERSPGGAKQVGWGGLPASSDSRGRPLTRIPSLRFAALGIRPLPASGERWSTLHDLSEESEEPHAGTDLCH